MTRLEVPSTKVDCTSGRKRAQAPREVTRAAESQQELQIQIMLQYLTQVLRVCSRV